MSRGIDAGEKVVAVERSDLMLFYQICYRFRFSVLLHNPTSLFRLPYMRVASFFRFWTVAEGETRRASKPMVFSGVQSTFPIDIRHRECPNWTRRLLGLRPMARTASSGDIPYRVEPNSLLLSTLGRCQ
jgi:hypothetical protein